MNVAVTQSPPRGVSALGHRRYAALLEILERRTTARSFDAGQPVSEEACRLILEAVRLSPSGANAQPWQFISVQDAPTRQAIAEALVASQSHRAVHAAPRTRSAAAPIDYRGAATAPGCFVIATDFRLTWAYPGLMDGTELDQRYHATAERIILQSVAAAIMSAHLAATALGFQTWWITTLGQDDVQAELRALLALPDDLAITDIMLFGATATTAPRRWKKQWNEISSVDVFNMANYRSVDQIDAWLRDVSARFSWMSRLK
jgi:nitroreductase